ncbi:ABC transporter permease [Blautia schinkii]|nr:ABC transporter permease [Blautia schinkii]
MLNLLRMDFYRVFRNKGFYVCLGILIFSNILLFGLLYMLADPSARQFLLEIGGVIKGDFSDLDTFVSNTTILEIYHQGTVGAGFFAVITGVLAALFVCTDFDSGFIKNIIAAHENKWDYILSKCVCLCTVNLLYLVINFGVMLVLNMAFKGFFKPSKPADILFYMLCAWLLISAFSMLTMLICVITRRFAAGVAWAICINSGLVTVILNTGLAIFGLGWITDNTIYMNLFNLPQVFNGTYVLRPVITAIAFFVISVILSKLVLAKKDI